MLTDHAKWRSFAEQAQDVAGEPIRFETAYTHNATLEAARFRLTNGLRIVVMADPRAPVFAYQSWFDVGSRDESPDRTGLAHLFEHLMFKGTHKHPSGTFDREMERRGSETNAATWVDWTYYTAALTTAGNNLETIVDFESDRMQGLVLDEASFRSELEVVKNERRMSVDNAIGGFLTERLHQLAFTAHPYRWPTIGAMEHLESATLEHVQQFYQRFYVPNNAVVVVVGDVSPVKVLTNVARAYGKIAACPFKRPQRPVEPRQREGRQEVVQRPIVAPQMVVGYHARAQSDAGYAALEVLNEVLSAGDSGRLYQRLVVEKALASDIAGYVHPFGEPGLYEVAMTLRPGVAWEQALDAVQGTLDDVARTVRPPELDKARNGLELTAWESLGDAEGCAEALGHHEVTEGDFGLAFRWITRSQSVASEALVEVADDVFRPDNRTVVAALPEGKT